MQHWRFRDVLSSLMRSPAERLPAQLEGRLREAPRCAVARYLLACHCFDRGRVATAVRHMMVAHRAEPELESAALLVFAGLNWVSRRQALLLPVLLDTWEEFRRPEFDRCPRERQLLDVLAEPDPGVQTVAPLAGRLWRLPIQTLRAQIREAIVSRDAGLYPLLTAPA
ncbi:hypothetical protein RAS1_39880 [Phycisphaerae bacterium RAS1]|nr:hypothetical protein RAS1_39880 [Phycisphaerae bacterium RAS1]